MANSRYYVGWWIHKVIVCTRNLLLSENHAFSVITALPLNIVNPTIDVTSACF